MTGQACSSSCSWHSWHSRTRHRSPSSRPCSSPPRPCPSRLPPMSSPPWPGPWWCWTCPAAARASRRCWTCFCPVSSKTCRCWSSPPPPTSRGPHQAPRPSAARDARLLSDGCGSCGWCCWRCRWARASCHPTKSSSHTWWRRGCRRGRRRSRATPRLTPSSSTPWWWAGTPSPPRCGPRDGTREEGEGLGRQVPAVTQTDRARARRLTLTTRL